MRKLFWMKFHTGDWLKDPKLSMCLPATRGIWIDALCAMHENGRSGVLEGTSSQLSRILRCTESALDEALNDLASTGTAEVMRHVHRHVHSSIEIVEVTQHNARNNVFITLKNRRMIREAKQRESNRIRQTRFKTKSNDNGKVTPPNNASALGILVSNSNISNKEKKKGKDSKEREKEKLLERFALFWAAYPRKEAKQNAWKAFQKLNPQDDLISAMISWIGLACDSEQWQDKTKIPHPATWLNQRRWEGDPPPKAKIQKSSEAMEYLNNIIEAEDDDQHGSS